MSNTIRLSKAAVTVLYGLRNMPRLQDVDFDKCVKALDCYTANTPAVPTYNNQRLEEIDKVISDVMQWLKTLASERCDIVLNKQEQDVVCGMLIRHIIDLHIKSDRLLLDAGVVTRGDNSDKGEKS